MTRLNNINADFSRALSMLCVCAGLVLGLAQDANARPLNICAEISPFAGIQTIYTVPPQRRLIINHSTIDPTVSMDAGEIVQVAVLTTADGVEGRFLAGRVTGDEFTFAIDGREMKLFADPDTEVRVSASIRNYVDTVQICLSGQLILVLGGGG